MILNFNNRLKINQPKLTYWEKVFVENVCYTTKEFALNGKKNDEINIRKQIDKYLENLYEIASEDDFFNIEIDSTDFERYYLREAKVLFEQGDFSAYTKSINDLQLESKKKELAEKIRVEHQQEYIHLVSMIKTIHCEPAFKALMLRETLKYQYTRTEAKDKSIINKVVKREIHKSTVGMMPMNFDILKIIYFNKKKLSSFNDLYFEAIENIIYPVKDSVNLDLNCFSKGEWIEFKQYDDYQKAEAEALRLEKYVKGTTWCTKYLAKKQLGEGEFFVFVDNSDLTRIAVKLTGSSIDEVRGTQNCFQEIEPKYREVALEFLKKNSHLKNSKKWILKEERNQRLYDFTNQLNNGTFNSADVPKIIEDLKISDNLTYDKVNTYEDNLNAVITKLKPHFAKFYKCKESEVIFDSKDLDPNVVVCWCNYNIDNFENKQLIKKIHVKLIKGNLYISNKNDLEFYNLEEVMGNVIIVNSNNIILNLLNKVKSFVSVENSSNIQASDLTECEKIQIEESFNLNFKNVVNVISDVLINDVDTLSLKGLNTIGGNFKIINSKNLLANSTYLIGRSVQIEQSEYIDVRQIKYVGQNIICLNNSNIIISDFGLKDFKNLNSASGVKIIKENEDNFVRE